MDYQWNTLFKGIVNLNLLNILIAFSYLNVATCYVIVYPFNCSSFHPLSGVLQNVDGITAGSTTIEPFLNIPLSTSLSSQSIGRFYTDINKR